MDRLFLRTLAKKRRGQYFTHDFLLSIILFLAIMSLGLNTWDNLGKKINEVDYLEYMEQKSFYITDVLIKTQGYPQNWNETTVLLPGLSSGKSHILNYTKINMMNSINNSEMIRMWDIQGYGYNLTIRNSTAVIMSHGSLVLQNASILLPYSRVVTIDYGNAVDKGTFEFLLWKGQ